MKRQDGFAFFRGSAFVPYRHQRMAFSSDVFPRMFSPWTTMTRALPVERSILCSPQYGPKLTSLMEWNFIDGASIDARQQGLPRVPRPPAGGRRDNQLRIETATRLRGSLGVARRKEDPRRIPDPHQRVS